MTGEEVFHKLGPGFRHPGSYFSLSNELALKTPKISGMLTRAKELSQTFLPSLEVPGMYYHLCALRLNLTIYRFPLMPRSKAIIEHREENMEPGPRKLIS